jgi:hypothetical protein
MQLSEKALDARSFVAPAAHLFFWGRCVIVLLQIGSWLSIDAPFMTLSYFHFEPFLQVFIAPLEDHHTNPYL